MIESGCLLSGESRRGLTDVFSYRRDDVFGLPVVVGIPGDDLAVLADEDGGERVGERFVVAWSDADVEELRDGGKIFFCWRGAWCIPRSACRCGR